MSRYTSDFKNQHRISPSERFRRIWDQKQADKKKQADVAESTRLANEEAARQAAAEMERLKENEKDTNIPGSNSMPELATRENPELPGASECPSGDGKNDVQTNAESKISRNRRGRNPRKVKKGTK